MTDHKSTIGFKSGDAESLSTSRSEVTLESNSDQKSIRVRHSGKQVLSGDGAQNQHEVRGPPNSHTTPGIPDDSQDYERGSAEGPEPSRVRHTKMWGSKLEEVVTGQEASTSTHAQAKADKSV